MIRNAHSHIRRISRGKRGFTLAEAIVVIVIMAIIASAGIGSATAYVKRSTLTQNDKNAETIYQAVQTGLQQMQKAGGVYSTSNGSVITTEAWVKKLIDYGTAFAFVDSNLSSTMSDNKSYLNSHYNDIGKVFSNFDASTAKANESVHMRYLLSYTASTSGSNQSVLLKDLIQPYFYDADVFKGTITVEFDVEKSADSYGKLHCSAKCLSVFYDYRAKAGWKSLGADNTVPNRSVSYRENTSLIGYFDGYKGTAVDTVYLPKIQEGIVVKKLAIDNTAEIVEKTDASGNPEYQEVTHGWVTWMATLDKEQLNGKKKDVYYRIALLDGDTVSKVLILNEDFLLSADSVGGSRKSVDYGPLSTMNNGDTWSYYPASPKPTVTVDQVPVVYNGSSPIKKFTETITKKSITVMARVYVKSADNDGYRSASATDITGNTDTYQLPLTITYIENEYDNDHNKKDPYIQYSLDITDFLSVNKDIDRVNMKIYPNYFSDTSMVKVNDEKGIISFKTGIDVTVEPLPDPVKIPDYVPTPTPSP